MKNKIYIGKNGIGKSKELEKIYENNHKTSLFINYSEKGKAPDSTITNKNNPLFKDFEDFLAELFTFKESFTIGEISDEYEKKFQEINNRAKNNKELDSIWRKMLEGDDDLNFIDDKNIPKIITSNKDENEFEITKKMYSLNLVSWKDTTKAGMTSYGTGKLAYFQIKFIYSHIELIGSGENKFLIVDEPELFLHNSLKRKMGHMLKEIGKKINVIVASHSPEVLSSFYDPIDTIIFSKKKHNDEWREILFKKPYVFTSLLEYFNALMADKIFVVEGGNDYKLIEQILNNKFWNFNANILIASRKTNIKSKLDILYSVLDATKNQIFTENDIYVLYDKDSGKLNKKIFELEEETTKTHNEVNEEIKGYNKTKWKMCFNENLEHYFEIKNKDKWNLDDFFNNINNEKKLDNFIKEFRIKEFLGSK